ncbi:MAG: DUF1549 domain-containing protein [Verrucomicrobia bacterium]|nr:DUF1549 domain-containing protein [Verrucomicrobiota bacterium]MBI3867137.1 DUF1549 domain-containing protein [Verrucomicrobiota bacterium]
MMMRTPNPSPRAALAATLLLIAAIRPASQGAETTAKPSVRKDPATHWAFQAPSRPPVPKPRDARGVRNAIDAFIREKLDHEGLKPSVEADKAALLRRASLDLIGLPPTVDEVDAFMADKSPGAYEALVDRLLQSPHYGERWGRLWLDAARYADSDGFEKDKPRFVWHYRDWVVNALNRNMPYDQFVIEQIAGDQLPQAGAQERIATGFLRNSMLNEEGGVDPEQFRMESMFDRMDCIGKSVLGLTIQCAQCHDHKYDPIQQEDYYRIFAFLNNDHESSMVAYTPEEERKRADLLRRMRDAEEGLRHRTAGWEERMAAWEDSVRNNQPEWIPLTCRHEGENGERFYYYDDASIRAASYAPTMWTAHFEAATTMPLIGAFRLEQLPDPNLPCHGPGRSIKGMAALSEFGVEAVDVAHPTNKIAVKFVKATADYSNSEKDLESEFDNQSGKRRPYGPVSFAIDGKEDTAWGIDAGPGRRNQARKAVFLPDRPIAFESGATLHFRLMQNHGGSNSDDNQNHNLGRFRLSATSATNVEADPLPAGVRDIFKIPRTERSPSQVAAVFSYWRTTVPEFASVNREIEGLWKEWPEGAPTLTLARRAGKAPGEETRSTRMFKRGDWLKPDRAVTPGTPSFLHPLPANADSSRLTFARWTVDKRSPTTARVMMNRMWQAYFGTGIVETSEDFGFQSAAPSHQALLDWLASEFMDRGWDIKAMHRLIATSATYRQSSHVTPALYSRDPYNRLLARGPRVRVDAEIVRDIALATSGLLQPALGGPSVYAPAPDFLFKPPTSYGPKTWNEEQGPNRYRRALYTFRFRSIPYPVLQNFDAPNGDFSCVRRARSNTPLQALTTMNEVLFMESAQALARRVLENGGRTDDERLSYAFRRVLSRAPTVAEKADLKELLGQQRKYLAEGWANPRELAKSTEADRSLPEGVNPTQLACYTVVSRVLLNLDEAITKE